MIEIVFTESACGALKVAQSFGKGKYRSGCTSVFISHEDGTQPTQEEIVAAQNAAEKAARRKWENAIPLGGKTSDVYGLSLSLSFGDIKDPLCIASRLQAFQVLFSFWNTELEQDMRLRLSSIQAELDQIISSCAAGEDLRIWYSDCPDELCGFYWLMDRLCILPKEHGSVYAIKQPQLIRTSGRIQQQSGWGTIEPGEFYGYTDLSVEISNDIIQYYGNVWRRLQEENTQIRACINGSLSSVPDDLYDYYIYREIDQQPSRFFEAHVIGSVLSKSLQGISDGLVHHRINQMVDSGQLISEIDPKSDEPSYWRYLRKE